MGLLESVFSGATSKSGVLFFPDVYFCIMNSSIDSELFIIERESLLAVWDCRPISERDKVKRIMYHLIKHECAG